MKISNLTVRFLVVFCAIQYATAAPASAASPWINAQGAQFRLIAGATKEKNKDIAAIQMKLTDGFTTYWRNPGDSGIAPRFDWSHSENVASIELFWPAPRREIAKGDTTNIYAGEVLWPLRVKPADSHKPVHLRLQMNYGVCSDICIPGDVKLDLSIPAAGAANRDEEVLIEKAIKQVPRPLPRSSRLSVQGFGKDHPHLEVSLAEIGTKKGKAPELFIEGPASVWFDVPKLTERNGAFLYTLPMQLDKGVSVKGMKIVLTFVGASGAYEETRILQ